jgi:uncharacterized protein (DUF433 family)
MSFGYTMFVRGPGNGGFEAMSTKNGYPHIEQRADGKLWLVGTQTKVLEVALDRLAHHWDADEIQRQHAHLTLGQIYSCLAYYHDHQEEMDRLIDEQLRTVQTLSGQQTESVLRAKLKTKGLAS